MIERERDNIRLVEYDILRKHPEVYAFSTYRQGGVSTGAYASLNCTPYVGDDPQCVLRNQQILAEALPCRPREWVIPWQNHGISLPCRHTGRAASDVAGRGCLDDEPSRRVPLHLYGGLHTYIII